MNLHSVVIIHHVNIKPPNLYPQCECYNGNYEYATDSGSLVRRR